MWQRRRIVVVVMLLAVLLLILGTSGPAGAQGIGATLATTYSISGRVTDAEGLPLAGVTIRAESLLGSVIVKGPDGNPVAGAQVYRYPAGSADYMLAGTTDADGRLTIAALATGDRLVARLIIKEVASPKGTHNQDSAQNWKYRVYITSMDVLSTGLVQPLLVADPVADKVLTLKNNNTLIGFNIVASVEWDADAAYLAELREGFSRASTYLYQATNGQMLFESVTIYDNNQHMGDADYQIDADNTIQPNSGCCVGGINHAGWYIFFGRYWSGKLGRPGSWLEPNGYRTFIHELGHYGLYLYDSYLDANRKIGPVCTSDFRENNNTPDRNATLMFYQYNAFQFSMRGVEGLWSSACEGTSQWHQYEESDWETIARVFNSTIEPATLKTPADYGVIVPGPTSIPVKGWNSVTVFDESEAGTCAPSPQYQVLRNDGTDFADVEVTLRRGFLGIERSIFQGKTDAQGNITVLGAAAGAAWWCTMRWDWTCM